MAHDDNPRDTTLETFSWPGIKRGARLSATRSQHLAHTGNPGYRRNSLLPAGVIIKARITTSSMQVSKNFSCPATKTRRIGRSHLSCESPSATVHRNSPTMSSVAGLQGIAPVPTSSEFIDIVLNATMRKTPTVIHKNFKISRIRDCEPRL